MLVVGCWLSWSDTAIFLYFLFSRLAYVSTKVDNTVNDLLSKLTYASHEVDNTVNALLS